MKNGNVLIYNDFASKILSKIPLGSLPGSIYCYLNCDYMLENVIKFKNASFTNSMSKLPKNLIPKIRLVCWTTETYYGELFEINRILGVKFKDKK